MALDGDAQAETVSATRRLFGHLPDGRAVEAVTLANRGGITATIITLGATLQALTAPDRAGTIADIVLGCDTAEDCWASTGFFGVTVGRYANRIAGGRFLLDGVAYTVPCNDGPNALHGGPQGFDRQLWQILAIEAGEAAQVTLGLRSPAGDQGFPGTLDMTATYALDAAGVLSLTYRATTDAPTIVNLTGHSYFNLAGEGSGRTILDHVLTIPADSFTPIDASAIPTGEIRPVAGTPFDFRQPTAIGARIHAADPQLRLARGYDHNFVLPPAMAAGPRFVARLADLQSGRVMELFSDQPGLQFYSGNSLDGGMVAKNGRLYRQSEGVALEPQLFPNTPNMPAFGSARLAPGETYEHRIRYAVSIMAD